MRIVMIFVTVAVCISGTTLAQDFRGLKSFEPSGARLQECGGFVASVADGLALEIERVAKFRYMMPANPNAIDGKFGATVLCDGEDKTDRLDRIEVYYVAPGSDKRLIAMAKKALAVVGVTGSDSTEKSLKSCLVAAKKEDFHGSSIKIGGHDVECHFSSVREIRIYRHAE